MRRALVLGLALLLLSGCAAYRTGSAVRAAQDAVEQPPVPPGSTLWVSVWAALEDPAMWELVIAPLVACMAVRGWRPVTP